MEMHRKLSFTTFLAIVAYFIFGLSLLFSKSALSVVSPFTLMAIRFVFAFLILNILLLTGKFKLSLKGKKVGLLLLLGLCQPIAYFTFETFAVNLLPTSTAGTALAICPILSILVGVVLLKEKSSFGVIFFALLSVVGVFLTTINQSEGEFSSLGFILILLAIFSAVVFNFISKKICDKFTAFERTYVMFMLGSVLFSTVAVVLSKGQLYETFILPFQNARFWLDILYLGGVSSVMAFFFLNHAMTYLPISKISVFNNLTAVVSIIAGAVFLNEKFGIFQIVGSIIVVVSVMIAGILNNKLYSDKLAELQIPVIIDKSNNI